MASYSDYSYLLQDYNFIGGAGKTALPFNDINNPDDREVVLYEYGKWQFYYMTLSSKLELDSLGYYSTSDREYLYLPNNNPSTTSTQEAIISEVFNPTWAYSVSFSDVANINFNDSGSVADSNIVIGQTSSGGYLNPGAPQNELIAIDDKVPGYVHDYGYGSGSLKHGDMWLNKDAGQGGTAVWDRADVGSWGWWTVMHELGHSLGLDHPNDPSIDNHQYSMMSYNVLTGMDGDTDVNGDYITADDEAMPSGLQIMDIIAIQEIYGINWSKRSGNNTYDSTTAFISSHTDGAFTYTIWDGGGIDEIDVSIFVNSSGATVDLRQGMFSSVGKNTIGGDAENNLAIAYHTIIENINGTIQNDILIGNAWNNQIIGGSGNDRIFGDGLTLEDDSLVSLSYSNDAGYGTGVGEHDTNNPSAGPASDLSGDDKLYGGGGDDWLYGGAGDDFLDGGNELSDDDSNYLDGGLDFDYTGYNVISELSDDLDVLVSAVNKSTGHYTVTRTYDDGTTTWTETDTLKGVERIAHAELRANTTTANNQAKAVISGMLDDGYVVIWQSQNQGSQTQGIYGQRYDLYGDKIGSEFQVSTLAGTGANNLNADVAGTADGGFVVVWEGRNTSNNRLKVFATKFQDDLTVDFSDVEVFEDPNTGNPAQDNPKKTQEFDPSVTVLDDGNIAIAVEAQGNSMNYSDIIVQVLDSSSGARIAPDEDSAINTTTYSNQVDPSIAALKGTDGGFVVVWADTGGEDGSYTGVFGQVFDDAYNPIGSEFQINQSTSYYQDLPSVTGLVNNDGTFVVSWTSGAAGFGTAEVFYREFKFDDTSSDVVALTDEIQVNDITTGTQTSSSVVGLEDGGFVVAFQNNDPIDGSASGIFAQQYAANGELKGSNFQVNVTYNNSQITPDVAALENGDFAISYVSAVTGGSGNEALFRMYSTSDSENYNTSTETWIT